MKLASNNYYNSTPSEGVSNSILFSKTKKLTLKNKFSQLNKKVELIFARFCSAFACSFSWCQKMIGVRKKVASFKPGNRNISKKGEVFDNPFKKDKQQDKLEKIPFTPPPAPLPVNIKSFLDRARKDITAFSFADLNKEFDEALKIAPSITQPEDKTTMYKVAEIISHRFVKSNFSKALEIRLAAAKIQPAHLFANLGQELSKADPILGLGLQSLGTDAFNNHTIRIRKQAFSKGLFFQCIKSIFNVFGIKISFAPPKTQIRVDAMLRSRARSELNDSIQRFFSSPEIVFKALPPDFCKEIRTYQEVAAYKGRKKLNHKKEGDDGISTNIKKHGFKIQQLGPDGPMGKIQTDVIHFKGVGKVSIGKEPTCHSEYRHLSIELEPHIQDHEAAEKLHIIFAALGLGSVSSTSRSEDIERLKVMQLFRAYFPIESSSQKILATNELLDHFQGSIDNLKTHICNQNPRMIDIFNKSFNQMYQQQVYPDQSIWCVKDLAQEAKNAGAVGLMAGFSGSDFNDAVKNLISVLKTGIMSTQDRFEAGIVVRGYGPNVDFVAGGAGSVYTRLITSNMTNYSSRIFDCKGKFQLLYDLDLVDRVGHCYNYVRYGTKKAPHYHDPLTRFNILDLTHNLMNSPDTNLSNEVCISQRVAPEYIKGILVGSKDGKREIIQALQAENLLSQGCFNGIPIAKFIHVGFSFKKKYWG